MKLIILVFLLAIAVAFGGCAGQEPQDKVAEITKVCMASGLFELADGVLSLAVPVASIPVALVNAGVEKICADPAKFVGDVAALDRLVKAIGK